MVLNDKLRDSKITEHLKNTIESTLSKHKANAVLTIDTREKTNLTDYMIIASGESAAHVRSLANHLSKKIGNENSLFVDGMDEGNWVVISLTNIIVHIFKPEVREYYNIEELWQSYH